MEELPHIPIVDSPNRFYQVVYEEDDKRRKDKVIAYLNQTGLIDYTEEKRCENDHLMTIRKSPKIDGWWWRCAPKGCQKTKSIRTGTFFFENRLQLFQVLLIIFNFAFEFLNTTINQLVGVSANTIAAYKRRLRLILLTIYNKNHIKLGGEGKVVEIDESLFIKVKHNRGRDILRPKVWVFGLYERATANEPKRVLFFKVDTRDAVTLLNIIYNHVLPGTTINSDCWAAYNRIIQLDRRYNHRTVNHSLTFVAPDGTHTNSIESTWRAAKRQFKEMNGVSRLYLQAYLDEYCWRLENGNREGWMIYQAIIRAIRDYFVAFGDANDILDRTIIEENNIVNGSIDESLDFGDFGAEPIEPLDDGDINMLVVPENLDGPFHMEQAMTVQRIAPNTHIASSAPIARPPSALVAYSDSSESSVEVSSIGSLSTFQPNQSLSSTPKRARNLNTTYTVDKDPQTATTSTATASTATASSKADFETEYKLILENFLNSTEQQYACPSSLTKDQRAIIHKLASDLNLNHESKGNWRKMTLYIYKTELIPSSQRSSQVTSRALQEITSSPQHINQNVLDVVSASEAVASSSAPVQVPKKRGRPPKSGTQPSASNEVEFASTQPSNSTERYNLRKRKNN